MRRWRRLAAAMTIVALLLCSGCSWDWNLDDPASIVKPAADYRSEYASAWCYRGLTPRMQQMYAAVYTAVREYRDDVWVSIRGGANQPESAYIGLKVKLPVPMTDSAEARRLFNAFTADNPQFFFLGNTYSYEGYRLDGVDYYDVFCLTLTMNAEERQSAAAALERQITGILEQIPSNATPYDAELFIHDTLATRITYDDETAADPAPAVRRPAAFTAYGALVDGLAVCEGYSRAMQLLLHRSGIRCTLVTGTAGDGASHMWNLAEIDGRNYHLDLTWDDADDRLNHTYFNLTTEEIALSHTLDRDNLGVDTCTATEANYYLHEKRYLDTYDRSTIAEEVARQVRAGADRVELRFAPDKFANAQLFFSNSRRLSQYVNPFLVGQSLWDYACQANETYHTIILYRQEET